VKTKLSGKSCECPESPIFRARSVIVLRKKQNMNSPVNKLLYFGFLVLGLYQCFLLKDYMQAASSLGIGMAFDPFDVKQKWNERPKWQKVVLIANLAFVAATFGFGIGLAPIKLKDPSLLKFTQGSSVRPNKTPSALR